MAHALGLIEYTREIPGPPSQLATPQHQHQEVQCHDGLKQWRVRAQGMLLRKQGRHLTHDHTQRQQRGAQEDNAASDRAYLVDLYVSYRSVYCGPQCQHQRSESDVSADDGPKEIVADFNLTDS